MAGYDWLQFLRRNSQLSKNSEGISKNKTLGMNKTVVNAYFDSLKKIEIENELVNKLGLIFNMDESNLQLKINQEMSYLLKVQSALVWLLKAKVGRPYLVFAVSMVKGNKLQFIVFLKGKQLKMIELKSSVIACPKVLLLSWPKSLLTWT